MEFVPFLVNDNIFYSIEVFRRFLVIDKKTFTARIKKRLDHHLHRPIKPPFRTSFLVPSLFNVFIGVGRKAVQLLTGPWSWHWNSQLSPVIKPLYNNIWTSKRTKSPTPNFQFQMAVNEPYFYENNICYSDAFQLFLEAGL